MTNPELLHLT